MRNRSMKSFVATVLLAVSLAAASPLQAATTRPAAPPAQTANTVRNPIQRFIRRFLHTFTSLVPTSDGEILVPKP